HAAGTCNPATGVCTNPIALNGTLCNDNNACTTGETCQNGSCGAPTFTVVCTASDQCHTAGTCNTTTGLCSNPQKSNGATCNDGDACTRTDTCQAGVCTGGNPVVCTALDQCHVLGVCMPSSGTCTNPNAVNGTVCSDGNVCTVGDACLNGSCQPGPGDVCSPGKVTGGGEVIPTT